jgi:predicted PurR-regulated permease PerM
VLTVLATGLLAVVAVLVLVQARTAVGLMLACAIVAAALHHAVDRLRRLGLGRRLSIAAVMLAVVLALGGIGVAIVPPAVGQVEQFVADAPALLSQVRTSPLYRRLDRRLSLDEQVARLRDEAPAYLQTGLNAVLQAVRGVALGVGIGVTSFFLVLFMLAFGGTLVRALLDEATPVRRPRYERVLAKIYRSIGGYLGGLAFICLVNAVTTTAFLAIAGVPFFLPLGLVSGLSSLVPLVGNTLAGVLITAVTLAAGGPWRAVATVAFFVLYQQFENHLLGPAVYRRTVALNPLVVVLALLLSAELGGHRRGAARGARGRRRADHRARAAAAAPRAARPAGGEVAGAWPVSARRRRGRPRFRHRSRRPVLRARPRAAPGA